MRILIVSNTFLPNVGGLENIMAGLANGFYEAGHKVTVITNTCGETESPTYKIRRNLTFFEIVNEYSAADRVLEANISLKTAILGILFRRKWFVVHHVHYQHGKGLFPLIKNFLTFFSKNIAVSNFINGTIWGNGVVIPNFYWSGFRILKEIPRNKDLVFVGRLVSDKGVVKIIDALRILKSRNFEPNFTIIGTGPQKEELISLINRYDLVNVKILGAIAGEELVKELNRHKIMVVPSNWDEPFGLVALEGLACGNHIICSGKGGLKEACGNFALIPEIDDSKSYAEIIESMLGEYSNPYSSKVEAHLNGHSAENVVNRYLQQLSK